MTEPGPSGERAEGAAFRPDLEGLRGLAILLVLLFHAGIPGITGGFIGVDVFFVLSGFLITGLLIREREQTGRVSLPLFYARRARRILPAALVVIVGTLLASTVFLAPLDLLRAAEDAVAVALSVGNIRFAATATDYFAATTQSPYLHYWSLGVEEQFYLLWPALLILATRFGRPRLGAGLTLVVLTVGSLVFAIWLTDVAAPWAFFSLPTRAWQLGLGGLLAIVLVRPLGRGLSVGLGVGAWVGLAAVVASAFLIDQGTPYPGTAALLPTVGAAAVIAGGTVAWSPGRVLAVAPMRFLGRISYSLYLVHWPILILPAASLAVGEELPLQVRIGLALLSVVVAIACWRLVEEPIHHARRFRFQPWRSLSLAGAAVATTLVIVASVSTTTSRALDAALVSAPGDAATAAAGGSSEPPASGGTPGSSAGAIAAAPDGSPAPAPTLAAAPQASPDVPTAAEIAEAEAEASAEAAAGDNPSAAPSQAGSTASAANSGATTPPRKVPQAATGTSAGTPAATSDGSGATTGQGQPPGQGALTASTFTPAAPGPAPMNPNRRQPLPANVKPSLRNAANDREQIEADGCELGNFGVTPPRCVYGDPKSSTIVALVGNSHAAQWFPALNVLAREHDWRLVVYTKISCRFLDLPIYSRDLKREYTECERWRDLVVGQLQALKPDLVVVSAARGMAVVNPADDSPVRQGQAMARLLANVPGHHAIIVDTPQARVVVPDCLSAHISDTRPCDTPRSVGLNWRYLLLERTAARLDGATLINMTDVLCPGNTCPAVLYGYITLRDVFHLTASFAASLAPELDAPLLRALKG